MVFVEISRSQRIDYRSNRELFLQLSELLSWTTPEVLGADWIYDADTGT